jgi:D-glycero-D-manno-heptose 1,7-bisphosphate phosphatase
LIWIGSPKVQNDNFLFLDRDGVVNEDRPDYIKHWREYRFYPDALDALRWLHEHDINVILISNQSGLHRGIIEWGDFWELHHRMLDSIRQAGGELLATIYCPHRPDENCFCRKPSPHMILTAARIYDIPLERTFMIGDRQTDLATAINAGSQGILVDRSRDAEGDPGLFIAGNQKRFGTLMEAVLAIPRNLRDL